jgi:hypothetical protein
MTSRPYDLDRRVPRVATATLTARRPRTASDRNRAAWGVFRWKTTQVPAPAATDNTGSAARSSTPLMRQSQHYLEERLASTWRCADFGEALEPLGLPATPRAPDSDSRSRPGAIATWEEVSYAGRLLAFNLAVVIIHIAALWWIFLRIGA